MPCSRRAPARALAPAPQPPREARERYALLSPREREVLGFIVAGLTNKEIGRALNLSPRTVETHRAHLFAKLGAPSLAHLILQYANWWTTTLRSSTPPPAGAA
jgi:FixJ family two-component response regulator